MTAREPSAVEVIAEATYRSLLGSWTYDSPVERAVAMWDPRPTAERALAALKAAGFVVATRDEIRAMSPSEQAEVIGGEVTSQSRVLEILDDHVTADGIALTGFRMSRRECVVGPWREVQP